MVDRDADGKLDHYSIRSLDLEASKRFYTEVMGFEVGFRPAFDFPGLWFYNGPVIRKLRRGAHHRDRSRQSGRPRGYLGDRDLASLRGTGTVDHMAFTASGLADMR